MRALLRSFLGEGVSSLSVFSLVVERPSSARAASLTLLATTVTGSGIASDSAAIELEGIEELESG